MEKRTQDLTLVKKIDEKINYILEDYVIGYDYFIGYVSISAFAFVFVY